MKNKSEDFGEVIVVSQRKGGTTAPSNFEVIAIDRRNPVLGNKHYLKDHNDKKRRKEVIELNAQDLQKDEVVNGPMTRMLRAIGARVAAGEKIALECWCAPMDCHGHTYQKKIYAYAGLSEQAILERTQADHPSEKPKPRNMELF